VTPGLISERSAALIFWTALSVASDLAFSAASALAATGMVFGFNVVSLPWICLANKSTAGGWPVAEWVLEL
jgi:hypothetical protein